jgi:hypothetical protein
VRLRGGAAAGAAALVLVVLGACGGGGGDATERVREAPDKTIAARTARAALNVDFSTSGVAGTVAGEGLADLANRRGALTLDLGSLGTALGAASVDTFLDATGIYVKLPPSRLPGNKPWLKRDLSTLSTQIDIGSLGRLRSADPSQALQFLKGAVDGMKEVGDEKVRGADTTHYRGTLDLNRARATASPDVQEAVDSAIASLGTANIPADVWLDDEGRMRKMRFQIDTDAAGPNPPGTVEFEMFDFGVDADVQPPPPDQITDLSMFGQPPR